MLVKNEKNVESPVSPRSKRDGVFALLNAGVKFENVLQLYPRCEDIGREWVETGPAGATVGSQVIGVAAQLLERSISPSPLISESFRINFMKALQDDPPEEFRCPIMGTLIRDPVVLSSGYVVDRLTALNEKGELRFANCPFTRKRLVNMVYPMESLRQRLSAWKAARLDVIMETMMKIMDLGRRDELRNCLQVASNFLDDIGREVYPRWAAQEHTVYIHLITDVFKDAFLHDIAFIDDVVHLFLSLWKCSLHDDGLKERFRECLEGIQCSQTGELPYRHLWIDAYGKIMHHVPQFDRGARLTLARQYLEFAKNNGDVELVARAQSGVANLLLTAASKFFVEDAGSEESCGEYVRDVTDDRDGCPHFHNSNGVSLLRYRFRHTGNAYWFIAKLDPNGDDACDIDYYRTRSPTEVPMPPTDADWICKESRGNGAGGGLSPVPTITAVYDSTHDLDAFFAEEELTGSPEVPAPIWTEYTVDTTERWVLVEAGSGPWPFGHVDHSPSWETHYAQSDDETASVRTDTSSVTSASQVS